MEIAVSIGTYNTATKRVPVTFSLGSVIHTRDVNAVLKDGGTYDRTATKDRVDQVALGVAVKIAAGVITNPPPAPELPATA